MFNISLFFRSVSNLQHYCRVCNTQLNSCKQSRIHAEGKKHEKRLAYLKFCFENDGKAITNNFISQILLHLNSPSTLFDSLAIKENPKNCATFFLTCAKCASSSNHFLCTVKNTFPLMNIYIFVYTLCFIYDSPSGGSILSYKVVLMH